MHRIIDIYEDQIRTRESRDQFGKIKTYQQEVRLRRELDLVPAGKRFFNFLIDAIMIYIIIQIVYLLPYSSYYDFIVFFIFPIYYIIAEYKYQQTIGKFITKTKVIDIYGNKPTLKQIVLRTLIRFVPYEILTFLMRERGWHDTWTKTYVLHIEELEEISILMQDENNLKK